MFLMLDFILVTRMFTWLYFVIEGSFHMYYVEGKFLISCYCEHFIQLVNVLGIQQVNL